MLEVVLMVCEKNSNETKIVTQYCQDRWIFFLDIELDQALFCNNNLSSRNITDFTNYLNYIFLMKSFAIFLFTV